MNARHLTLPALLAGALFTFGTGAYAQSIVITPVAGGATGTVNLTTEGTSDWAHYGLTTAASFDDKATGTSQISTLTPTGGTDVQQVTEVDDPNRPGENDVRGFTWTDGMPTPAATNTPTGVQNNNSFGFGEGLNFTAPASILLRTLTVYVGTSNSDGLLTVSLGDGSAPTTTQTFVGTGYRVKNAAYVINYSSAAATLLTVNWTATSQLGSYSGTDAIVQAATLQAAPAAAPEPSQVAAFAVGLLGLGALGLKARRRTA